ncbi:MAG: hypothetical protein H6815_14390 [Phycisphaeraceae bacterium]|nr:hypothetical protein [Phycisphaerales bacterium]MCB9861628.1 hypothetical protein [Phycisphaeraceae bacterium]
MEEEQQPTPSISESVAETPSAVAAPETAEPQCAIASNDQEKDEILAFPRNDKWNHRRGEPRVFALVWTCYLLLTTVMGFARLGQAPLDVNEYRPSARIMMVGVAVGIAMLWPMVRLSQMCPVDGGIATVRRDLPIILIPMQAMLWPQIWLGRWTVGQIGITACALLVWTFAIGGLLAVALGRRYRASTQQSIQPIIRTPHWVWMPAIIALTAVVPLVQLLGWNTRYAMMSPYTAVLHPLRNEWTQHAQAVTPADWTQLVFILIVAMLCWILAYVMPVQTSGQVTGVPVARRAESD